MCKCINIENKYIYVYIYIILKIIRMIEIPVETHCIKFSDNGGEYLYASGEDGIIRTWDWKIGNSILINILL